MTTMVKSSNGITLVPEEARLLAQRKLFIEGEITSASACAFVRQIMILLAEDKEQPIDIFINSPGGEVNAGMLIYDTLKSLKTPTNLYCLGMAASMAAILLAAGEKGRRFVLPHSKVMIHEPLISGGVGGSATSIQRTAESIMETRRISVELLANDTGKSTDEIEKAISFDNFMNAQEAVDFGLCDAIVPLPLLG